MDISALLALKTAPRVLFERVGEFGGRPRFMVRDEGGTWNPVSWRAFGDRVVDFSAFFLGRGVDVGDRVAIFAANSTDWAACALGIQAIGGVMVPIYSTSTPEQLEYVVGHSDSVVVMTDFEEVAHGTGRQSQHEVMARMDRVGLDDGAIMLYTSGTSGRPKGVPLTHRNLAVNGRDWLECNAVGLHEDGVDVLWLPLSHVFGFGELCLGNMLGFTSWMSTPQTVMADVAEVRPTVFMSVPSVWEKLALPASMVGSGLPEAEPDQLYEARKAALVETTGGRMRFCLSGGAGLKVEVKELLHECGVTVIEGYGLTEASPTLTLNRPDDFRFDSVGKPLPSVEIRLADDGEILARGPNVFAGYHKDPAASAEVLTVISGISRAWASDGFLQIVDRKKDILVTAGGKNVPPANIEVRFRDDPLIEHLVVFGDGQKYLVAGVWLRAEAPRAAVQAAVDRRNAELPRYMTIKKWALMEPALTVANGFLTPTLKVKRKAVYAAFGDRLEALYRT